MFHPVRSFVRSLALSLVGILAVASVASAGPVILAGHDADDHLPTFPGNTPYRDLFDAIDNNVTNGSAGGIVSIGSSSGDAVTFINTIAANMSPPRTVTHVNDAAISTVNFNLYRIIHVPSDNGNTPGGILQSENTLLAARATDIANFINNGGGLFGLTQDLFTNQYAYMGVFANIVSFGVPASGDCDGPDNGTPLFDDVTATAMGMSLGITDTNIDGCCWHNTFSSFAPFLNVLATANQLLCPNINLDASVIGCLNCSIPGQMNLTPPYAFNVLPSDTMHTVTATFLSGIFPNPPISGVLITFTVLTGPNAGATGMGTTNASGQATFNYTGNGVVGVDEIRACGTDPSSGNTVCSNIVLKFWDKDCQPNGRPDTCDISCSGFGGKCTSVPTGCGGSADANSNGIPDECAVCGNGILEAGEQCDDGNPNPGDCCFNCLFESSSQVCRASTGVCDPAEFCTGTSAPCPADVHLTTECRASTGVCDPAEFCDGLTGACPADVHLTTECRASTGVCDPAEFCDGLTGACPADVHLTTECRASTGVCDPAEFCDGLTGACPADVHLTTECRASTGVCDPAEFCDGVTGACPADVHLTTECRASTGVCDPAEFCDGLTGACPADVHLTTECRASTGVCDPAEFCDGLTGACPADVHLTTECRASTGVCDPAEFCDGVTGACPADVHLTTECRASTGVCDPAEFCDGLTGACPADGFAASGTPCADDGNECTNDVCDGNGACTHPDSGLCGACCLADKDCIEGVLAATCAVQGGTHQGNGSVCAGDSDGDGADDLCDNCPGVDDALFAPFLCYDTNGDHNGQSCQNDADCPAGYECTKRCAAIPTVSQWGLVVLALMLMVIAKVGFGRRQAVA